MISDASADTPSPALPLNQGEGAVTAFLNAEKGNITLRETKSTCPYCGVGCGVIIEHDGIAITGVRGDADHPANFGKLCSKGSTLHQSAAAAKANVRVAFPEMRRQRSEPRKRASWDDSLDFVADKFAQTIREHGPDSVGFYISGQLLTEDYYVFNKLAKGLIGTNNVDTNSRLCMSSAVAGYKATLGADAPPSAYEDIDCADCIFLVGSNAAYAHPILFRRIEAAKEKNPHLKIIVADPRRTDTAEFADLFLPITPGSDVALFHGLLHLLINEGAIDRDYIANHTENFSALIKTVANYPPAKVAELCCISIDDLRQAAQILASSPSVLSLYCQGLNQSIHGTAKNATLINLHLAMGKIGKPGSGPFSLTGQPNAMGGREVGGMANLLSAHRDLANPQHRAEVAALWGVDEVPAKPGKTAVEMFEAAARGEIKCLWICCTNPAQSMPDQNLIRAALEKCELVVVQECFADIDTVPYADVLLPATTWGEKDGTVTNSERRITRVNRAVKPHEESRNDWKIVVDFALKLDRRLGKISAKPLFPYTTPEQIWNEHRESTRGRDLDITGMSYTMLETAGPQQWPLKMAQTQGKTRLYEDGVFPTESGRAKFYNCEWMPTADNIDDKFPLRLTTGRLRDQWHGMSRTGLVTQLFSHVEEPMLGLQVDDMRKRLLNDGDVVEIKSKRGTLNARVQTSSELTRGVAYLPMHWGSQFMSGAGVNAVTTSAFDPVSRQPELKHAAVEVSRVAIAWQMMLVVAVDDASSLMRTLKPYLNKFAYASLTPVGATQSAVVFRAFHTSTPETKLISEIDALCGVAAEQCDAIFDDLATGISKRARVVENRLTHIRLIGETLAVDWVKDLITQGANIDVLWPWLFAPLTEPPVGGAKRGRIICTCHDVGEVAINECFMRGEPLQQVQQKLKCGTGCGSCVPELKRMLKASAVMERVAA